MHHDDLRQELMDDEEMSVSRWIPTLVVTLALAGFFTLAWYAYHSGTQSIDEKELMVVEADKTPFKEKPLDPGGMKFPNQDKTVFDTFSGKTQNPPKVERLMPPPEEPMPKAPMVETESFVQAKPAAAATATPVITPAPEPVATAPAQAKVETPAPVVEKKAEPAATPKEEVVTHVAKPTKPAEKVEAKPAKPAEAKQPAKKEEAKPAAAPAGDKTYRVQLGAYASEKEAQQAWEKISKKHADLQGQKHYVLRADLGAKGIFYRLRVGDMKDAAEAKALCAALTAKGQACLVL